MWPKALHDAAAEPRHRLVATWGPGMYLEEFLKTRVVEAGVHGLDLAHALDRPQWLAPEASEAIRRILVHRLGAEPYGRLGWDDVMFIEKGTGRLPLTDDDRAILADAADTFPLLA